MMQASSISKQRYKINRIRLSAVREAKTTTVVALQLCCICIFFLIDELINYNITWYTLITRTIYAILKVNSSTKI